MAVLELQVKQAEWREKYLKRIEEANDQVRAISSLYFIENGVEPTEENLNRLSKLIDIVFKGKLEKHPIETEVTQSPKVSYALVPEKVSEKQEIQEQATNIGKLFGLTPISFHHTNHELASTVFTKVGRRTKSTVFGLTAVYFAGYINGLRAERIRRKSRLM